MGKRNTETHNGRGAPRARLGTKVVSAIATFSLVASMCPGAAALAFANDQLSAGAADLGAQALPPKSETIVTKDTHRMTTGVYKVTGDVQIDPDGTGNGIQVEKGARALIYIDKDSTLTVKGADAIGNGVGHAAILLPEGSTLTVDGDGTLNATGGRAGNGADGGDAEYSHIWAESPSSTGLGGHGGAGGGGAGAGIGTDGGAGGAGGEGGERVHNQGLTGSNIYGHAGKPGASGSAGEVAGTFIAMGKVTVNARGGAQGAKGGAGGERGCYQEDGKKFGYNTSAGTSGGGGGGGIGSRTDGIGPGGTGGGGGGGGASGSFDGEFALLIKGDLDDLWGHGGEGGESTWNFGNGAKGDEGASNGGDDTGASKKYARAGGAGGASPIPNTAAFYFFKVQGTSYAPKVNCATVYNMDRHGTQIANYNELMRRGGLEYGFAVRGLFYYDGKAHRATLTVPNNQNAQSYGASALSAQAAGDEAGDGADSGSLEIDGYTVDYEIAYYDEAGEKLDSAPVMPGQYLAVASYKARDPRAPEDYTGNWAASFTIAKRQVPVPTPAALTFECADWETGEGAEQDAFPGLDEADYAFVAGAKADDVTASLRSAKAAGEYRACFKLKDPETCEWADGTEGDAAWVPWSIKLSPFDPNDVTYWGPAGDDETTTVDYTGKPQWVRPWYTYTKAAGGEFPKWFTHWGSAGRPTTHRLSSCVVYLRGDDDREGLVGYHTNSDGSLEEVTAEQVYAWANGVDIDGKHVAVESGDKVWYKTDKDGWKVPLAVEGAKSGSLATQAASPESGGSLASQAASPEGAEGYVVARDYAYADKLGVKDVGEYQAYALFDEGTGFETTSLAQATVKVKAPASKAATPRTGTATKSTASATPKTGDLSPLVIGGFAVVALLGAGVLALTLLRRRS